MLECLRRLQPTSRAMEVVKPQLLELIAEASAAAAQWPAQPPEATALLGRLDHFVVAETAGLLFCWMPKVDVASPSVMRKRRDLASDGHLAGRWPPMATDGHRWLLMITGVTCPFLIMHARAPTLRSHAHRGRCGCDGSMAVPIGSTLAACTSATTACAR